MQTKMFEIRDANTFIPVLATRLFPPTEAERYLLARSGFGRVATILLTRMYGVNNGPSYCDPYGWDPSSRTMAIAHAFLEKHFEELETGSVVDVQFILGETTEPKKPERIEDDLRI